MLAIALHHRILYNEHNIFYNKEQLWITYTSQKEVLGGGYKLPLISASLAIARYPPNLYLVKILFPQNLQTFQI